MRSDRGSTLAACLKGALLALSLAASAPAAVAQKFELLIADAPGTGFLDPSPAAPAPANPGRTLGEQRLNAMAWALERWAEQLDTSVTIRVAALWVPLACTTNEGVLAAAGPWEFIRDFRGAQRSGTWYPVALANRLARTDLNPDPGVDGIDAVVFVNSRIGAPDCIPVGFGFGLDENPAESRIDLKRILLHELGHTLGFTVAPTRADSGERADGRPSIWEHFMFDNARRSTWANLSQAERAASAVTPRNLVWEGPRTRLAAGDVLLRGQTDLLVSGLGINRTEAPVHLGFSPEPPPSVSAVFGRVVDQPDGSGLACAPLSATNASRVNGRIALLDRGACPLITKVANVQAAGALAAVLINNVPDLIPDFFLIPRDPSITIPAVMVAQDEGAAIRQRVIAAEGGGNGVFGLLFRNELRLAGADLAGRPFLFTPPAFAAGSSVSHWDVAARPDLLMEPGYQPSTPFSILAPTDLTLYLMRDIGW